MVEPLYDEFDPATETESRSSGMEHPSYHNHRHLLEQAGFDIQIATGLNEEFH
ncbi:MAG: hypothetical protein P1V20_30020 [Verrucomicrobiales bacterium]|nr:hypothetical protein [Verrucomicrobiales bacterium]